jgi:glycosyltransferase involved in cell wall biosynthesis
MQHLVSVIVPTKNRPDTLPLALASIGGQDYPSVEVIVINDGGVPVGEIVDGFTGQFSVKLIELPKSVGASGARNVGLDNTTGEYVAFLDDDDIFLPAHLGLAVRAMTENSARFAAAAVLVYDRCVPAAQVRSEDAIATFSYPNAIDMLPFTNPFPASGVVCRSLRETGIRFDRSLRVGEDWDMWLRLIHGNGYKVVLQEVPSAVYTQADRADSALSSSGADLSSFWQMYQNFLRICQRWPVDDDRPAARLRLFMELFYLICIRRLTAGSSISALCFDKVQAVFSQAAAGIISEAELRHALFALVGENPPEY